MNREQRLRRRAAIKAGRITPCEDCNGTGEHIVVECMYAIVCPSCAGTGQGEPA